MTELRRWALAAAAAVPLSLGFTGVAAADPDHGPDTAGHTETSVTYAGIGGAGTIDSTWGIDHHGNEWSEEDAVVAGPTGAAVVHTEEFDAEESDIDTDDDEADDDDKPGRPTYHGHGKRPVAHTDDEVSISKHRPVKSHPVRETRPSHVVYAESTKTADEDGATSSHVVSHAGDDHAVYESSDLSAGPDGAVSEGVNAVAVPQYASYDKWYTAADEDGAITHEVTAVADATDWPGHHRHHSRDRR
ncbi:hypothetical protein [Amycolatopsis sp. NPDC052450]|uniref:hypothetical protein n=1 Tax=Amycolatopsis sp. NPDC052450 TaxID=3363937 RepID=UPI0037C6C1DC